jgi:anti-anti-sigma factor
MLQVHDCSRVPLQRSGVLPGNPSSQDFLALGLQHRPKTPLAHRTNMAPRKGCGTSARTFSASARKATVTCEVEKLDGLLRIRGEMTIYDATAIKDSLFAALDGEPAARIDLQGVSELDTTGIQILIMAERASASRGVPFSLTNPSDVVKEALELLRLTAWFAAPAAPQLAAPLLAAPPSAAALEIRS